MALAADQIQAEVRAEAGGRLACAAYRSADGARRCRLIGSRRLVADVRLDIQVLRLPWRGRVPIRRADSVAV